VSIVLSETRETGCAVVSTQADDIPEPLDYGGSGLLTPPKDSDASAKALTQLLENPDLLHQWKQGAHQSFVDEIGTGTKVPYGFLPLLKDTTNINPQFLFVAGGLPPLTFVSRVRFGSSSCKRL
jgi:hypothetical protein